MILQIGADARQMMHEVDTVAAWSVDRLGRSLQHLVAGLGDLQASGVGLYLHKQGLDTSTPTAPPSPTPDSISKCGEPIAPADRINSRPAAT